MVGFMAMTIRVWGRSKGDNHEGFLDEYGARVCVDEDFVEKCVDSDDMKECDDGDSATSVYNGHVSISDDE